MLNVTKPEYILLKQYIESHCGIYLEKGKEYLIETRLSELANEVGAKSFQEFHFMAKMDISGKLKDRIIDLMTTNETSWFRDASVWGYIKDVAVPALLDQIKSGEKIRVWSAAASTGQEAYSFAMCMYEEALKRGIRNIKEKAEIIGTDISSSAIKTAKSGKYDSIAIKRGLPSDKKIKYFEQKDNYWYLDPKIKNSVRLFEFNLQNSFSTLGTFDLILCRYVTIYFSETFKKSLFSKFARALKKTNDVLLLGATESIRGFSDEFEVSYYNNAMINKKK